MAITVTEVENLRRSASMAPLSADQLQRVFVELDRLARKEAEIDRLLAGLPASWSHVRETLNELRRVASQ